jgi:hypothetical protein
LVNGASNNKHDGNRQPFPKACMWRFTHAGFDAAPYAAVSLSMP